MASDYIPFDIWLEIASYLSRDDCIRLYSVNRALFEISMDERYRLVCFRYPEEIAANLDRLM